MTTATTDSNAKVTHGERLGSLAVRCSLNVHCPELAEWVCRLIDERPLAEDIDRPITISPVDGADQLAGYAVIVNGEAKVAPTATMLICTARRVLVANRMGRVYAFHGCANRIGHETYQAALAWLGRFGLFLPASGRSEGPV